MATFDPILAATLQGRPSPEQFMQEQAQRDFQRQMRQQAMERAYARTPQAQVVRQNLLGEVPGANSYMGPRDARATLAQRIQPRVNSMPRGVAAEALGRRPPVARIATPSAAPMSYPEGVARQALGARPPSVAAGIPQGATQPMSYAQFPDVARQALAARPPAATLSSLPAPPAGVTAPVPPGGTFTMGPDGGTWARTPGARINGLASPRSALAQTGGGFRGAGMLNLGLGTVALGMPGALEARGVDFNRDIGPVRGSGQAAKRFFEGAGGGTMVGGPLVGTTTGLANANRELAAGQFADEQEAVAEATGNNRAADLWLKSTQLGRAVANPIGYAGGVMDPILDKAGSIPVIGGFFGGDSEESQTAAEEQAPQQPAREYNATTLNALMDKTGVAPQYRTQLLEDYNVQLELARATATPIKAEQVYDMGKNKTPPEGMTEEQGVSSEMYKVIKDAGDAGYQLPDEAFQQQAWEATVEMIPQILQQQQSQDDYLARQASLQAVIAPFIGDYYGRAAQNVDTGYQAYADAIGNLPAGMQGAAANYANVASQGRAAMGDALAASLAMQPGLLAMEQGMTSNPQDDFANIYQNQLNQKLAAYQIAQQYPELVQTQGGGSGGVDELFDL